MNKNDVEEQAEWELSIERFEQAVEVEKERLRNRKVWFPYRIRLINVNAEKKPTTGYLYPNLNK